MAATSSGPAPRGRILRDIHGCSLETDPTVSTKLLVTLRISYDPNENTAIIRLRMNVSSSSNPLWIDVAPENLHRLSLQRGSPTCLHLDVACTSLIVPRDILFQTFTVDDRIMFDSLRLVARRSVLQILLPDGEDFSQLTALCEAVRRGGLHSDPGQVDLKTLYRGNGGRVVQVNEEFWPPTSLF